ncbi:hypothetical protein NUU61_003908 [Penicillium alfredii]|uniref:Uncharacterized protein n=1 Tax=Penicillium alfredii TaxID=1506179 RepID=A0A9W9KDB1_9EURO|nr:uncharacterized protein NUU61_003908 [Penicillium alfredii]KAJ5101686.1 hypothetical protein NUU61_003908 [Penicillium alfredii]
MYQRPTGDSVHPFNMPAVTSTQPSQACETPAESSVVDEADIEILSALREIRGGMKTIAETMIHMARQLETIENALRRQSNCRR